MTDKYVFNPDIHEDWTPPAHRCGNCAHHEHEVVEVERIAKDGSELAGPTEGTCCYYESRRRNVRRLQVLE